ncbi:MAG: endopeptidase La [Alphaproteobacteria bacterium]|nr:endopeptidase La [Alphaproteobacteria bacterium]
MSEFQTPSPKILPVLPLRDIVVFPHMVVSLFVGRKRSIEALSIAANNDGEIILIAQRDGAEENPGISDLYSVGAVGKIVQKLKLPDGSVKVLVEGHRRIRVHRYDDTPTHLLAEFKPLVEVPPKDDETTEIEGFVRTLTSQFEQYVRSSQRVNQEILGALEDETDYSRLADVVAAHLPLKLNERQDVLEQTSLRERLEFLLQKTQSELDLLKVEKRIRSRVRTQVERTQREYYLNEQLKAIQKELGDGEDSREEMLELEEKLKKTRFSREAKTKATAEMRKLKNMNSVSAEATVVRNYLDWLISVPWKKYRRVKADLAESEKVLEREHYGLEKVKERILEYLAVQSRTGSAKGQILCLVGPPGVGKSSLGRSIAEATGRAFVRVSLGGVRDEAEIRGHRRTYIGSMPGRILQGMKKAGSSNPLFLLDEVDKIGSDWRGDPASALLEVLDPEQNHAFNDHYLEVDYDLSKVMFITTANTLNISRPLLDRMEIIRIAGYTEDEKLEIARRHLIPRQYKENGLKEGEWQINDAALARLIREYTRESGVRNLERELAKLMRKAVKRITMKKSESVKVTARNLEMFSGVPKYRDARDEEKDLVGVATGLAWTEVGGELLLVEAVTLGGKGRATATGTLGDVMRESVQAAESYVKSRASGFGIRQEVLEKRDIHVHVPEGATPKDGPSAGVAVVVAIVSALTGVSVRREVAMTGEITLRGRVLSIGGLKEKLLAAQRSGVIEKVLVPEENRKDMADIPAHITKGLDLVFCTRIEEVLGHALSRDLEALPVEVGALSGDGDGEGERVTHH